MVTGLIYAAIVVLWAAYLVPLALRRYDEAARDRSIESRAPRMLRRQRSETTADTDSDAEPDSASAEPESQPRVRNDSAAETARATAPAQPPQRESTRIAVRRRRRTLLTLLVATTIVAGLGYAQLVPWWAVSIPGGLVVAWLIACRIQVLGETTAQASNTTAVGDQPDDEPTVVLSGQLEDYEPHRKNVMLDEPLDESALEQQVNIAVPLATEDGHSLWDPVPVTLPTYATQPPAARTVRTIDFNDSDAWTSGHVDGEQTEMPERDEQPRRAVGD